MLLAALLACTTATPPTPRAVQADADVHPALAASSAALAAPQVLNPAPDVHVALGYALANVVGLRGPSGWVIVDTTEGRTPATEVLAAFRQIADLPVAAVILTHNHADHVMGGRVFTDAGTDVPVWSHARLPAALDRVVNLVRDATQVRAQRMFGTELAEAERIGAGIGMRLRFDTSDVALARPTHTYEGRTTIEAGGLMLELIHVPGETDDQTAVWWPERGVLLPADDIYRAFPNLYTIRGTPTRDVAGWIRSLDTLRELHAGVLVPQHTHPLVGADEIAATLTAYRDAIQYVHDQTVRGLNAGRTPDELAATVALPAHLADHPWLAEHYGRVPWSVRGIYGGYLGWFGGDASTLEPLPPAERSRRYVAALAAGRPLPVQAEEALAAGEHAWAAELAAHAVRADPEDATARTLLARAYEGLARGHVNANAVHWYRTAAHELRGELTLAPTPPGDAPLELIESLPLDLFLHGMPPRLRAEETLDADVLLAFVFPDVDRAFTLHVRRGIAELRERPAPADRPPDATVTVPSTTFKRLVTRKIGVPEAVTSGGLEVDGVGALTRVLWWLRP
ncbi:MAG: MBL fold metallo-hydrolase [Alphaproteobacteria bacterium]|nr:MBL fold metallo-hydrolase [Alphaproteobacteria bacterium]